MRVGRPMFGSTKTADRIWHRGTDSREGECKGRRNVVGGMYGQVPSSLQRRLGPIQESNVSRYQNIYPCPTRTKLSFIFLILQWQYTLLYIRSKL